MHMQEIIISLDSSVPIPCMLDYDEEVKKINRLQEENNKYKQKVSYRIIVTIVVSL